jgi:hypothetical protein
MISLTNEELMNIDGGAGFTATLLNALSRAITTVQGIGRSLGSAIRRIYSGSICSL